ncbi:TylF/MycF/NovP-related O-methyltransferase [Pedobacter frigoris]|uniref:Class I SAM-dependent methyltransferase n=1 Tax=Pedobacter frigoris TaxID=2571272 RepID=A0A4V5P1Z8_9SPHI|nr:TylF/MycF/NovP-related O-methyltransferase [Pedobacter frigoris]TKC05893.1 hypothetical protein FA047_11150 [Pedobacter frigoris]
MDNYFLTKPPYGNIKASSSFLRFVNKGLRFLKLGYNIAPIDTSADMNTVEQRINYFHLLGSVLNSEIQGDVIELGCFTGQCAMLFQKAIQLHQSDKTLHLYDSFEVKFKEKGDIQAFLIDNFKKAQLDLPVLHKGYFQDTIPGQLPEQIAFAHIDCGFGGDKMQHKDIVLYCLNSIYPRMTKGSVCILMDYYDPEMNGIGIDINPGVKLACDEFLKDKPEKINGLYGNQYFHAYFRKA